MGERGCEKATGEKGKFTYKGDKPFPVVKKPDPLASSDRREKEKLCVEFRGKRAVDDAKNDCEVNKGQVIDGSCPNDGVAFRCAKTYSMGSDQTQVGYDPTAVAAAEKACTGNKAVFSKE